MCGTETAYGATSYAAASATLPRVSLQKSSTSGARLPRSRTVRSAAKGWPAASGARPPPARSAPCTSTFRSQTKTCRKVNEHCETISWIEQIFKVSSGPSKHQGLSHPWEAGEGWVEGCDRRPAVAAYQILILAYQSRGHL
eukprot:1667739-Rhodomonas_salina.2